VTVSVVIPSRNRPGLVGRAVQSALDQTFRDLEVVVVVDGPDQKTVEALGKIADPRLRVVNNEASVGAQDARNIGIRQAQGLWIAFLDDDDEWLPAKLERQLEAAQQSRWPCPIVSCGLIARGLDGDQIYPTRAPFADEPIADYLFLRRHAEVGEIRLQTSTLMMTRDLLTRVSWRRTINDEWDLLLRASVAEGAGLAFVFEPLAIWHSDAGAARLSAQNRTWRNAFKWFRSMREFVGPRAYASFLLYTLSTWAHRQNDWMAFLGIPFEAIRRGNPTFSELLIHTVRWVLPERARNIVHKIRRTQFATTPKHHIAEPK
jgi:glycosyltransferase involved in cell wall biosynthesis